jgi:hypothetical protein
LYLIYDFAPNKLLLLYGLARQRGRATLSFSVTPEIAAQAFVNEQLHDVAFGVVCGGWRR